MGPDNHPSAPRGPLVPALTSWDRLLEALVPASISEPDERARARFSVTGWLVAIPLVSTFSVLYWLNQMWGQLALQVFTVVSGTSLVALLRLTGRLRLMQQLSFVVISISFGLGGIAQTPADPSSVFFMLVVPLLAGFLLDLRAAWTWLAITLVLGVTLLQLGQHGYTLDHRDPDLATSMSLNYAFGLTVLLLLARSYAAERQRALEQVRRADRERALFLANVSHEIRTPMNGVLGMTQVLLQSELTASQREQLLVVQRSGDALVALINDVLDASKVEAGQLTVDHTATFDAAELLSDLEALYGPMARERGLELTVGSLPGGLVQGDGLRVRQVLSNLVSNAIKFTARGHVRLEATRVGPQLEFVVEDTGPGIPQSLRARLFQPFQQGDTSTTRRYAGTGLGLSLSRQLAQLLGGSVELDDSWHTGARFRFHAPLPLVQQHAPTALTPAPEARSRLPVLIVDDNAINLAVARALVGKAGYAVEAVTSGGDALTEAASRDWALVLMDVMMPGLDGLETTRRIRQLPGSRGEVPIIALTASAMPEQVALCRAAGMNDVLAKPVSLPALTKALAKSAR